MSGQGNSAEWPEDLQHCLGIPVAVDEQGRPQFGRPLGCRSRILNLGVSQRCSAAFGDFEIVIPERRDQGREHGLE